MLTEPLDYDAIYKNVAAGMTIFGLPSTPGNPTIIPFDRRQVNHKSNIISFLTFVPLAEPFRGVRIIRRDLKHYLVG